MSTAIKLVDTVPVCLSPEERSVLVRSTPASFNDIPPTLRHKEDNVSVKIVPALPGFSDQDSLSGSLYVLETYVCPNPYYPFTVPVIRSGCKVIYLSSVLVFMSATGRGFQIEYPSIILHAVSRANDQGPAVYCQLDENAGGADQLDGEDATEIRELCILPQNDSACTPLPFFALCRSALIRFVLCIF
jgi:nucleotide-sensitive chloride channel 1A